MPTRTKDWPFPPSTSVVGNAEEFVYAARQRMADDLKALTREVLGKQQRAFLHVPLTPEEREVRLDLLLKDDTPDAWGAMLDTVKDDPTARAQLLAQWRAAVARIQQQQQQQQSPPMTPGNQEGVE